ncbi:hypothetical protein VPH35_107668 [Triticum aestivum]
MESTGEELLREILVKLPTRDLALTSCVSQQWRTVVGEPSFCRLHASATHVVSGQPETLAVTEIRGMRICLEAVVLNFASKKTMCRITDLAGGYGPTNACNGFLCFAANVADWPLYVCNPVTGEKIKIAPPSEVKDVWSRIYTMGFSASTHKYKLFRFPFYHREEAELQLYNCEFPPAVLINGKLYVLAEPPEYRQASEKIIVIDVASETHCIYHLPKEFTGAAIAEMHTFNLSGHLFGNWELRYTFDIKVNDDGRDEKSRGTWFDEGDRMLCYRLHDHLYQYGTTNNKEELDGSMQWDHDIQLPDVPPHLVSPRLAFASPMISLHHTDKQELFEKALLQALRCKKSFNSKKSFPTNVGLAIAQMTSVCAKRICEPKQ